MFWQREVIRDGVSMTFNQTYELDLPKNGLLGSLVLYIRSTEAANALATLRKWRLIDYISKIEVVANGSTVIKSLDGLEALAAAWYDDGVEPVSMWRSWSSVPHRQWIPIHFGRFLQDALYGLDLSKYDQVTLKITNDATATQFTTDITISVIAYYLREAAGAFGGHFREEVWKSWDPVAAAVQYSELPTELMIRRILLEARPGVDSADAKNNSSMHRLMNPIKFTLRTGQTLVFEGPLEVLGHLSTMELRRPVETRGNINHAQGYGFESGVGYAIQNMGAWATDADAIASVLGNMRSDVQDSAQELGYVTANGNLAWSVRGHGYNHTVPLWSARAPDLSDMLDPAAEKVVKVDITCQSGTTVSGTSRAARNAIILSRLVR